MQNKHLAWKRMCQTKEFQLWLRKTLGQEMHREAEEARFTVPADDVKIENMGTGHTPGNGHIFLTTLGGTITARASAGTSWRAS